MKSQEMYFKQRIIENMLQAARVKELGFYIEDGFRMIISGSDVDMYEQHFLKQAYYETLSLLREMASAEDYEVG